MSEQYPSRADGEPSDATTEKGPDYVEPEKGPDRARYHLAADRVAVTSSGLDPSKDVPPPAGVLR